MIGQLFFFSGGGFDAYQNLALEQYLTETAAEDACTLYLWQNRRTVVLGRNQNAWRECRTTELAKDGGTLARRLSGGGAVYHDLGNLNFTFCMRSEHYDLARQQRVLLEACRALGVDAVLSGRNDLLADGRKFSGNSFYSHHGRAFHNGTLLIDTDMEMLGKYLRPSEAKLRGNGVASVRSRVVNLRALRPDLTVEEMRIALRDAFEAVYGLSSQTLREADFDAARLEALRSKFSSYDWTYGRSVAFDFSCAQRFPWGEVTLELAVKDALVRDAAVYSDALDTAFAASLSRALPGCRFTAQALCTRVRETLGAGEMPDDLCALVCAQNI